MRVVTIASGKGGSGKTTLAATFAVVAAAAARVGLVDLDAGQGSLTVWAHTRDGDNPLLVDEIRSLSSDIRLLRRASDLDWLIIDTPPHDMKVIEGAVAVADLVVIPVRPSALDILAIEAVIALCRARAVACVAVVTAVLPARRELAEAAERELEAMGLAVLGRTADRVAVIEALAEGRAGFETDKTLRGEATRLWAAIRGEAGGK